MQYEQVREEKADTKNIIVLGKTGQGKSYFLNLLLQEERAKKGTFPTFSSSESGTQECQLVQVKTVQYGHDQQDAITMNLIDTPGLFDTKDDIQNEQQINTMTVEQSQQQPEKLPRSINHLIKISNVLTSPIVQQQISRVLLVISATSKFDAHQKAMIEICKVIIGKHLRICAIITKCQHLYQIENESEDEIFAILQNCRKDWTSQLGKYGIEDVFFIGNSTIKQKPTQHPELNNFYQQQWENLYFDLKKSIKQKMYLWNDLSFIDKASVGKYFSFTFTEAVILNNDLRCQNDQACEGCLSLEVSIDQINDKTLSAKRDFCKIQCNKINIKGKDDQANQLLGMIHYSEIQSLIFLKFTFAHSEGNGFVELTRDHLIYCCNRQEFLRADLICLNDTLLYNNNRNQENVRIIEIQLIVKEGYYSPLTNTGQFFGNGILLSSYISPSEYPVSQQKAHLAMQPLIIYRQLMMNSIDSKTEKSYKQATPKEYESIYPKMLRWIFYNHKQQ